MFFRKKKIKFENVLKNVKSMTKRKRKRKRNISQIEIRKIKTTILRLRIFFLRKCKISKTNVK